MKKILLSFLLMLFLTSNLFAYNYYYYIGRKVVIQTSSAIYIGKVLSIQEENRCELQDNYGHCLSYKVYCFLILDTAMVDCEKIQNIYEVPGG